MIPYIHVPEAVDGENGQIFCSFAQMIQWVRKLEAIGSQEIHTTCKNKDGSKQITIMSIHAPVKINNKRPMGLEAL